MARPTILRNAAAHRFTDLFGGSVSTFEGTTETFVEVSQSKLHDVLKADAQGASFGLSYDWCAQRWVEAA